MTNIYDIANLYNIAHGGTRGIPFGKVNTEEVSTSIIFPDVPKSTEQNEASEFINIQKILNVKDIYGRQIFAPCKIGELVLPNEPTMSVSMKKTIVETPMVGTVGRGSVKEYINTEDYVINIRGVIINDKSTHIYPEDWVKQFHNLWQINESLPIVSPILTLLGVDKIVIKAMELPEMIGVEHAQRYSISMVSDYEFQLEIS